MTPFINVAWATPVQGSLDLRVAGTDDVHFGIITGGTSGEATKLYSPYTAQTTAIFSRFPLAIPNGATITSAIWDVYNSQSTNDWTSPADDRTVGCEQVDSAAAVTTRQMVVDRYTNVGSTITWSSSTNSGTNNAVPNSPNLASIVQAIVNRPGWVSGNYIGLWWYHGGVASGAFQSWGYPGTGATTVPRFRVDFEYFA